MSSGTETASQGACRHRLNRVMVKVAAGEWLNDRDRQLVISSLRFVESNADLSDEPPKQMRCAADAVIENPLARYPIVEFRNAAG
jgi:hypothetical protein